jgi:ferric-dicitrate binding protein FerR (iron transport regulator)
VKQINENKDIETYGEESRAFFSGGKILWKKSSSEIWDKLDNNLTNQQVARTFRLSTINLTLAIASGLLILLSIGSILRFYSITVRTPAGQHFVAKLPDKSSANLNAESKITYYPLWWMFERIVESEGEVFFEVEKGKHFIVKSGLATTSVIGTSFNIFSREEIYKVTCVTGSVKVLSGKGFEVTLKPGSKAELEADGTFKLHQNIEIYENISWKDNVFLFTASPVFEVFKEIERQYGVKIESNFEDLSLYTGNFSKDQPIEEILGYVCPALGFKYIQQANNHYLIIANSE